VGRYTLWCLNRVAKWDLYALREALRGTSNAARLGSRERFDDPPYGMKATADGVLMYEDPLRDEYFVPIVVKCVGNPLGFFKRLGSVMSLEGQRLFEQLLEDYPDFYRAADPLPALHWRNYWGTFSLGDASWNMGMLTRAGVDEDARDDCLGYYEIVRREAKENDEKAVLVGYSQGGLVARFLAWMDEQLMPPEERVIAGVITVQSPNHGSPLAGQGDERLVSVGLLGMLTALAGVPIVGANPSTHIALRKLADGMLRMPPSHTRYRFGVNAFCAVLDHAIVDAAAQGDQDAHQAEMLRTARKWLTGLSPDKVQTAFFDLDPSGLDDERTVLGRLIRSPHRDVFHGAVIGANSSLEDLILQTLPWYERFAIRKLVAPKRFTDIESSYSTIAMNEEATHENPPETPLRRWLAHAYTRGLGGNGAEPELPRFAHDFAIPSVSETLCLFNPPPPRDRFLGNVVNRRATHISGGEPRGRASDVPYVLGMLGDLSRRLARVSGAGAGP